MLWRLCAAHTLGSNGTYLSMNGTMSNDAKKRSLRWGRLFLHLVGLLPDSLKKPCLQICSLTQSDKKGCCSSFLPGPLHCGDSCLFETSSFVSSEVVTLHAFLQKGQQGAKLYVSFLRVCCCHLKCAHGVFFGIRVYVYVQTCMHRERERDDAFKKHQVFCCSAKCSTHTKYG